MSQTLPMTGPAHAMQHVSMPSGVTPAAAMNSRRASEKVSYLDVSYVCTAWQFWGWIFGADRVDGGVRSLRSRACCLSSGLGRVRSAAIGDVAVVCNRVGFASWRARPHLLRTLALDALTGHHVGGGELEAGVGAADVAKEERGRPAAWL